jgi:hypothetical protein
MNLNLLKNDGNTEQSLLEKVRWKLWMNSKF